MKKLLHERLRNVIVFDDIELDKTYLCINEEVANDLADEIERYYIPRPRFEDGEVVDWDSDDIDWNDIMQGWSFNAITKCGVPLAYADCARAKMKDGFVVRKQPKVLDADGVEIKVGDTVWCLTNGGQKGKARYLYSYGVQVEWEDGYRSDGVNPDNLTHKEPVLDADGVPINVGDTVWSEDGEKFEVEDIDNSYQLPVKLIQGDRFFGVWNSGKYLTHNEPDSREKIIEDFSLKITAVAEDSRESEIVEAILDRYNALIERGA